MKETIIASIDRITEQTAYFNLDDGERELQLPCWTLPDGAEEGMAFTITIERNEEEEEKLRAEIAQLRHDLGQ